MIFTDQCGNNFQLNAAPKRIISLVPSLTEYLFDLNLEESIVGLTKFCVHPRSKTKKTEKIGGTKNLNLSKIRALNPDLIIANKEENTKDQVEELMKEFPVCVTQIGNYKDALEALKLIGNCTGSIQKADEICSIIENQKSLYQNIGKQLKVCYLIWKKPYMTIGADTFVHDMLTISNFENVFSNRQRYPKISLAQIKSLKPDVILLSSEPYPFKEEDAYEINKVIDCDIILVNGELFSWYGSRMMFAFKYFQELYQTLVSERSS